MSEDDFFVGYLPASRATRRRMAASAFTLLLLTLGLAALLALFQRHPGYALEGSERGEFRGVFVQSPYPHLWLEDGPPALMVRGHKAGFGESLAHLDGSEITVRGQLFRRAGAALLVVFSAPEGREDGIAPSPAPTDVREISVVGEVVDSKCYFGQMRPGDGTTHRACAQLCVRGGIPVLIVERTPEGERPYVLVGDAAEGEAIVPYLAEHVQVRGRTERLGGLRVLHVASLEQN
ncbi:MAG: hypothetical protein AAF411_09620 [Myxococcota bacterium]